MNKKKIAVIAGGDSAEYVISLQSAEEIAQNIDREKFEVFVVLMKSGQWELTNERFCGIPIDKNDFSFRYQNQRWTFDLAFIAIHGTPGEDGKIQSYFELIGLPYVGSNVLASALTFNKFYCNNFLRSRHINVAHSVLLNKNDTFQPEQIAHEIGFPMFVKPNAGGSSFGISKVRITDEIAPAIEKAFRESDEVIVEQFIDGKEYSHGIIRTATQTITLPVTEIISKNDFFDYAAKYNPDLNEEITPARISDALTKKCQQTTAQIAQQLNCTGISRIDYMLKDNTFYFIEINTIPGMSKNSIVPQQIRGAGYTEKEIFTLLIEDKLAR